MAYATDTTRRSLFAIAGAAVLLPSAVQSAPRIEPNPWAELIAAYGECHPNAAAAIANAIKAGVDPATLACVTLRGQRGAEALPVLWFGDIEGGQYSVVSPIAAWRYARFA